MRKIILTLILILIFFSSVAISDNDPTYEISGYSIDLSSGNQTPTSTVTVTVKENGNTNTTSFTGSNWKILLPSNLSISQNKFTIGLIVNTSDEKMGYNQLIIGSGSFASQTQKCSTKRWHFRGYAVDSSGRYISQANITVGVESITGTNTTRFYNGIWDIYHSPCLVPGEIYTFKFIITADDDKRSYMFLNEAAK